jgi:hypothetical protein
MSAAADRLGSTRRSRGSTRQRWALLVAVIAAGVTGGFLLGVAVKSPGQASATRTALAPAVTLSGKSAAPIPAVSAAASLPPLRRGHIRAPAATTSTAGSSQSATSSSPTTGTTTPSYSITPTVTPQKSEAPPAKHSSGAALHEESGGGA